jgi:hypothetical protein
MENDTSSVRLSPSQKAYRDNPQGFLERLGERAATLFEYGYRVYPGEDNHVFVVTNASRKEETQYRVNGLERTCDCPFFAWQQAGEYLGEDQTLIPCKHLLGLSGLVRKTRQELYQRGKVTAFCALSTHWMKHLSALRQERIQATQQEEATRVRVRPTASPTQRQSLTGFRVCGAGWQSSGKENGKWRR